MLANMFISIYLLCIYNTHVVQIYYRGRGAQLYTWGLVLGWRVDCLLPIMIICLQSEQGSAMRERDEKYYVMQWSQGRMMGDGGIAGWRAVGVLFIVGMDEAAVRAAQRADDHQHQPGQF